VTSRTPEASIVIPAFNEAASLGAILERLAALPGHYQIVVVNDGSTDGTREILTQASGVTVVHHERNRGYGASLMSGIREAQGEIIVTFDADGQHDHDDIARLLDQIDSCAMVVGARSRGSYFYASRVVGHRILFWIAESWTRSRIPDINSGLRAFHKSAALRYEALLPSGFSFTTTLTLALLKEGYPVRFVPIVTRTRVGKSSFRLWHGLRVLKGIFRMMVLFRSTGRLSPKPSLDQES
jgi:glycosyltransferase involved in cell wall biosynthesis